MVVNFNDPSEKPGSILTTLINGFLLPKQLEGEKNGNEDSDPSVATLGDVNLADVTETVDGFPVTNILSGIYNLVSSYIKPSVEELDEEPITAIPQNAINVHNMPRDQLIDADVPYTGHNSQDLDDAPALPAEFLRGTLIINQPRPLPESISGPVLILNENVIKGGTREPVNIPLPNFIKEDKNSKSKYLQSFMQENL